MRLQVLESILRDIRELDTDPPSDARKLFNTVEYLSFVVNHRLIPGAELAEFFKIAIVHWYESVFPSHDPSGYADPAVFVEFRRLYHRIKWGRPPVNVAGFGDRLAAFEFWASTATERREVFERLARLEDEVRNMRSR